MPNLSILLSFISFIQSDLVYYVVSSFLAILVLIGIALMSKVKTAKFGNGLSALSVLFAVVYTMIKFNVFSINTALYIVLAAILIGVLIGSYLSIKVKMIQMPELVALLNGAGGGASAFVGALSLLTEYNLFEEVTAYLALIIGALTLSGSIIAALKLAKMMDGRPIKFKFHSPITSGLLVVTLITFVLGVLLEWPVLVVIAVLSITSLLFGYMFSIRVGGADMPITISLLNSLSGVAGAIAGMAVGNVMLVAIGGIVGASGLVLTQIMCKSMNRSLLEILLGKTSVAKSKTPIAETIVKEKIEEVKKELFDYSKVRTAIIVPGYGMALAQAQHLVKQLEETLTSKGVDVKYAIHPVAGRMPGHMNVLLAEANVDYDVLYEMHDINDSFKDTDLVVVVGANDVLNPSARSAEGTPIYGMPILNVDQAKHVIICNYDTKPGYAGVENPLYNKTSGVELMLGDAKESLEKLLNIIKK
ncbi:MAG: NAD(P)(+) transhydrogenase (Re/Si-specific) subunit beta [Bacilli bacterium]